jgi:hypothetical protein
LTTTKPCTCPDDAQTLIGRVRSQPDKRAEQLGHTVEWDPPHALSSASRWTCTVCGAAVLSCRGNVYGTAIEKTCDQAKADYEALIRR